MRSRAGKLTGFLALPHDRTRKLIVVTAHRRESFGEGFLRICEAIGELASRPDVQIVWPVHPNPNVQRAVDATLRGKANVMLIEPLDYVPFVDLMLRAHLLITDSGGVQEEGPSLGKPILVLREKTERPEAVDAGTVKLVGTDARNNRAGSGSPARRPRGIRPHGAAAQSIRGRPRLRAHCRASSRYLEQARPARQLSRRGRSSINIEGCHYSLQSGRRTRRRNQDIGRRFILAWRPPRLPPSCSSWRSRASFRSSTSTTSPFWPFPSPYSAWEQAACSPM